MGGGPRHQHAHAWHLARSSERLLRACRERPRRRSAADEFDELASI
jgi:hypothetical protein